MDSRIYFHQFRRPRVNNPTEYHVKIFSVSNNVLGSMTFFSGARESNRSYLSELPTERYQESKNSNLSQYGANAINTRRSHSIDQRDVHNKQTTKFDIINLHPKEFDTSIKQYPRFTLENKDECYYNRINKLYEGQKQYNSVPQTNYPEYEPPIAGKKTFNLEPKIAINPEKPGRFTPKMLNHMDELHHLS